MSSCSNCETKFKFSDTLKGFNPASVKCSGCSERVKSSYLTLLIIFVVYMALFVGILSLPLFSSALVGSMKLITLGVLALVFEYLYFYLLNSGKIKSNLNLG
jgi:hypothetical protein